MDAPSFPLIRIQSVRSTQEEARRLAEEGCASGTILLAEEQTAGRGRGDRSWASARGLGIWMTLVHRSGRPVSEWPALTSVAALAVCRALEAIGLHPLVKWPNDVLLGDRKVAGILAETVGEAILIGIGINLLHEPEDFPSELRETATSVRMETDRAGSGERIDIDSFLGMLLPRLRELLVAYECLGSSAWLEQVWERSVVRDGRVSVERSAGDRVNGVAAGLGPIGELLLDTGAGVIRVANGTLVDLEER